MITRPFLTAIISIAALAMATCLPACSHGDPLLTIGIDDSYTIARMQLLVLDTPYNATGYKWIATSPQGATTVLSTSNECRFVTAEEGRWTITLTANDNGDLITQTTTVNVMHEEVEYSPYISSVLDFHPAPGQFVNVMPRWRKGDTEADMIRKAGNAICGDVAELVSLGAFGGYIVFSFDHTVVNVDGEKDFMILGNAFYDDPDSGEQAGSAEPGIVMVSLDTNGNGIPDDPWFELAGSEYNSPLTIHDYKIRYKKPDESKTPVPEGKFITDAQYVEWTDSEGATGFVKKNVDHTQSYWPGWMDETELTFTGTRLANNARLIPSSELYYRLYCYPWGYADNQPNNCKELCSFDISWAVDQWGMPVKLPGISFVKVCTALNQECNWLGETSTEIAGAIDLHIH